MIKPEICHCGHEAYKRSTSEVPLCAIHFVINETLDSALYSAEDAKKLEQAIVDQVHARIRND